MLKITLLGPPQITLHRESLSKSITGKRLALLAYLAVTGKPQSRDRLADLLWSDVSTRKAKKNLRDILPMLRKQIGDYLIITRQTITFNRQRPYWLDVEVFGTHVGSKQVTSDPLMLHEVLNLYQGEFLSGFYVRKAPTFEDWALLQRRQLDKQVIDGLHRLANHYLEQADYETGLTITGRLLSLQSWDEQAHRLQMKFLALSGQRTAALAQYAICQQGLAEEYGTAPLPETRVLYEKIKDGTFAAQASLPYQSSVMINWDAIPTRVPLHGRQSELETLTNWLTVEGCQVVGLFGFGGQGKSTLVAQLVDNLVHSPTSPLVANRVPHSASVMSPNGNKPQHFERIIWYSLVSPPPLPELLAYFLDSLLPKGSHKPTTLSEQLATLLGCLRQQRSLLVLDHLEAVMQDGQRAGRYQPTFEPYSELLHWLGKNKHNSCLILMSRQEPEHFTRLVRDHQPVRAFYLGGLSVTGGVKMLREAGLQGEETLLASLVEHYAGHPLALRLLIETSQEFEVDELEFFLEPLIFDELRDVLDEALSTLSAKENDILSQLAMLGEPVEALSFCKRFAPSQSKAAYLSAQRSLRRRSLLTIEQGVMSLTKIISAYMTQ